jgi:peptidyl-tRNA hydrolase
MYIVIRGDISPESAVVAAAHASLGTYLQWQDCPIMQQWQKTSFVKILCKSLHKAHFDFLKKMGEHRVFTESKLDNMEVSIGFRVVEHPHSGMTEIPLWNL